MSGEKATATVASGFAEATLSTGYITPQYAAGYGGTFDHIQEEEYVEAATRAVTGLSTPGISFVTNKSTANDATTDVILREKAIEAACKASGFKDMTLEEFSNLLDFFYVYLKTGEKLKF